MKVLHVIPGLFGVLGGPAEAAIQLCEELKNQGIEVGVATTIFKVKGGSDKMPTMPDSVPVHAFSRQFNSILPKQFALSLGFRKWLRQHIREYDLLHIHFIFTYPSTIACNYAKKYNIPYIVYPAGMLSKFCLRQSAFKKKIYTLLFERRNINNAAAIQFTSQGDLDNTRYLKLNDSQRVLFPHALNLGKFGNIESLKGIFRKQYPQTNEKKIVLFLSRLDPIKGLDLLIPALGMLAKKRNDFVFVLAGSGTKDYERWVKGALDKAGLTGLTILTGFVEGTLKYEAFCDADIFVLSSYHESFGVAVAEAMAASKPVIISEGVGIHKLIEDYRAGLVTKLDSRDIAEKLDRLLSDGPLQKEMGNNGKRLVEEKFDIRNIAREMIRLYSDIILRYKT